MAFKFDLGQVVTVIPDVKTGQVRGRAEFMDAETMYSVRYVRPDGHIDLWWPESGLIGVQ